MGRYVDLDGARLWYEEQGDGEPLVLPAGGGRALSTAAERPVPGRPPSDRPMPGRLRRRTAGRARSPRPGR